MRFDLAYNPFRLDVDPASKAGIVRPENLAYARFETNLSFSNQGILDIVFESEAGIAIVPWITLEGVMLMEPEESIFVWPAWMRWLPPETSDAIEARLEPWMRARVMARYEHGSGERYFDASPGFRDLVSYARGAGWAGAAPSAEVLRSLAPHRYAWRYAQNADALVRGIGAANGGALLARRAASVRAVLSDVEEVKAASRWFGLDIFASDIGAQRNWGLYVGPRDTVVNARSRVVLDGDVQPGETRVALAEPLLPNVTVSFDLDDAPEIGAFSVGVPEKHGRLSTIVEPAAAGGSGGRVALVVREDCLRGVDGDTDGALSLAGMLKREGFSPEIVTPSHFDVGAYDLIHVFGFRYASAVREHLEAAAERGIPIALTPYADDSAGEHRIQVDNVVSLASASDEGMREVYIEALAKRKLQSDNARAVDNTADERRLFELANVAFVTCQREEDHIRKFFGYSGPISRVPALASPMLGAQDVSAFVGEGEFLLLRGPVQARTNTYLIARAAAMAGLPLVVSGQVLDAMCYIQLCHVLGDLGVWVPSHQLTEGQQRGLVSRARVVVDVSWSGMGLHHLASAAAARCALVASSNGYAQDLWGEAVVCADPASVGAIESALRLAWDEAEERGRELAARTAARCDPFAMLVATATGYQSAAATFARP